VNFYLGIYNLYLVLKIFYNNSIFINSKYWHKILFFKHCQLKGKFDYFHYYLVHFDRRSPTTIKNEYEQWEYLLTKETQIY